MKLRPTWSEALASPFGCFSLADASSSLAVLAAPHARTTRSPEKVSVAPSRSKTTPVTAVPSGFVSSLTAFAFLSSVTFSCSSAGRTPSTSASALGGGGRRAAGPRSGRGRGGSRRRRAGRRAVGSAARETRPGGDRDRWQEARSGPHPPRPAPGTVAPLAGGRGGAG